MTDPRNIAHDKEVQHDEKNHGEEIAPDSEHVPQPGKKPAVAHDEPSPKSGDSPAQD